MAKKLATTLCVLVLACSAAMAAVDRNLPNFGVVAPGLYRGAAPTDAGLAKLKQMGVKTIVDLRIAPHTVKAEAAEARKMGFQFVNLPMGAEPPTKKQVATFLALAGGAPASPIYVHCQHGADRTGTMVGIYRETHDHWTFERAYAEMRHYGFNRRWTKLRAAVQERAPDLSAQR